LSGFDAISKSAAFAFWAFIGVESASVSAGVIENPKRNVPIATIVGLVISAVLYISICTVLMGIIPASELAKSDAPLAAAVAKAVGPAGGVIIAICAILKSFAALTGWTLTISQSAQAAAEDGVFPRLFGKVGRSGIPITNFVVAGILMSLVVVVTSSGTLADQFNELIDMAILLTLLPYLYSVVAFLKTTREAGSRGIHRIAIGLVAGAACLYCLWAIAGSDATLVRDAMIVLFLSVPFYTFFARGLEHQHAALVSEGESEKGAGAK
jgi:arginine:agmatine antiporter